GPHHVLVEIGPALDLAAVRHFEDGDLRRRQPGAGGLLDLAGLLGAELDDAALRRQAGEGSGQGRFFAQAGGGQQPPHQGRRKAPAHTAAPERGASAITSRTRSSPLVPPLWNTLRTLAPRRSSISGVRSRAVTTTTGIRLQASFC